MLSVKALGPGIGAEILGVDLSNGLATDVAESLNAALLEHNVLVIRNQTLAPHQYLDALSTFGEPMAQHRARFNLKECPLVSEVASKGGFAPATMWHTDHTNHEVPPKITALYGVKIPVKGGDTAFADMAAAWERLPQSERDELASLYTFNSMDSHAGFTDADRAQYPGSVRHPMARVHPETGKPALYFHVTKSQEIEGMATSEVRPFLESLLERTISSGNVYRHQWRVGDLLICDNRCTMHRVHADFDPSETRLLWRLIIHGDRPVGLMPSQLTASA